MDQQASINKFVENYQHMDTAKQEQVVTYLTEMLRKTADDAPLQRKSKTATITFSYPKRGHPNDGNPALMAIFDIMPQKELVIKENDYTRERAIWLCHDYNISWKPDINNTILANALERIRKLD
jgi:hypothetical protein